MAGRCGSSPLLQRCASIVSSHRPTSTGYHVACVSNFIKKRKTKNVVPMLRVPWRRCGFRDLKVDMLGADQGSTSELTGRGRFLVDVASYTCGFRRWQLCEEEGTICLFVARIREPLPRTPRAKKHTFYPILLDIHMDMCRASHCCRKSNLNDCGLLDEHLTACGIIPSHPYESHIDVVPVHLVIAIFILSAITVWMAANISMATIDIMISATLVGS